MVYTIEWSGSGGVVKIKSSFDLVAFSADLSAPLTQTFDVEYQEATGNKNSVKYSGNPGYIVGEPIRAGKLSINGSDLLLVASLWLCWPSAILFYRCSLDLLFSPPNLRCRLADRHQTLPRVRR